MVPLPLALLWLHDFPARSVRPPRTTSPGPKPLGGVLPSLQLREAHDRTAAPGAAAQGPLTRPASPVARLNTAPCCAVRCAAQAAADRVQAPLQVVPSLDELTPEGKPEGVLPSLETQPLRSSATGRGVACLLVSAPARSSWCSSCICSVSRPHRPVRPHISHPPIHPSSYLPACPPACMLTLCPLHLPAYL